MKAYSITDVGCTRSSNQDYVFTSTDPVGALPNLYILADGMGGHAAGEYASKRAVEIVFDEIRSRETGDPMVMMEQAVTIANSEIKRESDHDRAKHGMGTTMVICSILDAHLFVSNVGDSRLYVFHEGKLFQITKDHSLAAEIKRSMDADTILADPPKNMITRAIGAEATIKVDGFEVEVEPGDLVLMCSDGLTNMVSDDDITRTLSQPFELKSQATQLLKQAKENGGKDNISLILVDPFFSEVK